MTVKPGLLLPAHQASASVGVSLLPGEEVPVVIVHPLGVLSRKMAPSKYPVGLIRNVKVSLVEEVDLTVSSDEEDRNECNVNFVDAVEMPVQAVPGPPSPAAHLVEDAEAGACGPMPDLIPADGPMAQLIAVLGPFPNNAMVGVEQPAPGPVMQLDNGWALFSLTAILMADPERFCIVPVSVPFLFVVVCLFVWPLFYIWLWLSVTRCVTFVTTTRLIGRDVLMLSSQTTN